MEKRIKLYLDVDGVLNIFPKRTKTKWPDARLAVCHGFNILHSPQMGARLAALDVDIHWLTTWCDLANEWIGPLFGWDELPVVGDEFKDVWARPWWKLQYMQAYEPTGPFIWIDDDLNDDAFEWAETVPYPKMLVRTATHLTSEMLDEIEAWVEKITCM